MTLDSAIALVRSGTERLARWPFPAQRTTDSEADRWAEIATLSEAGRSGASSETSGTRLRDARELRVDGSQTTGVRFSQDAIALVRPLGLTSDSWKGIEEGRNQRASARVRKGTKSFAVLEATDSAE